LPFSASSAYQDYQEGRPITDTLIGTGMTTFGVKANPISLTEKLNQLAPNGDFWNLDEKDRNAILEANPEVAGELQRRDKRDLERATRDRTGIDRSEKTVGFANLAAVTATRLENERKAEIENPPTKTPKTFREQIGTIQANAAAERAQVDKDFQLFKKGEQKPKDDNEAALFAYYDLFDQPGMKTASGGLSDRYDSAIEALRASWSQSQRDYVDSKTGQSEHTETVQQLYDDRKKIAATRYWDVQDEVAKTVAPTYNLEVTGWSDLEKQLRDGFYQAALDMGYGDVQAGVVARRTLEKTLAKADGVASKVRKQMRESDSDLMRLLVKWEYYIPGEETLPFALGATAPPPAAPRSVVGR